MLSGRACYQLIIYGAAEKAALFVAKLNNIVPYFTKSLTAIKAISKITV